MKHTKNILKSLLITVMALSLLAVSCSKDEGGSKLTDPTVTIDASTLDGAIQLAATQLAADTTLKDNVSFDFSAFESKSGAGSATATVTRAVTGDDLKTALEGAFTLDDASFSSKATLTPDNDKKKATLTITITVKGNNTFASDVKGKYAEVTGDSKSVKTVITITGNTNIIS